jgi:hypothetical protein
MKKINLLACTEETREKDTLDARRGVIELDELRHEPLLAEGVAAGGGSVPRFRVSLPFRARHREGAAWVSSLADTSKP